MRFDKGFLEVISLFRNADNSNQTPEFINDENAPSNSYDTRGLTEKALNNELSQQKLTETFKIELSQQKLTEAIIWSEVLGKPLCKRRKSR